MRDHEAPTSNQTHGRLIDTGVTITITARAELRFDRMSSSQSLPGCSTPGTLDAKTLTPSAKIRRISSWITCAIG
jgi:hypothetical protein